MSGHSERFAVRPVRRAETAAVAELWVSARRAAFPAVPAPAHPDAEAREWFVRSLLPASDTRVAESAGGEVVGVLVVRDGWLDQLYVAEQWTGRGAGAALPAAAQADYEQLSLWTFVSNPVRGALARSGGSDPPGAQCRGDLGA
jgi:GNAT superfamily N-acetyltransferase